MKTILNRKTIMMVAGVLAAVMIVLSQSFYRQQVKETEKAKTEQQSEKSGETYISAPGDVVAQSNAIHLDDQVPALQRTVPAEKENSKAPLLRPEVVARYFKILFRAIISPNAP